MGIYSTDDALGGQVRVTTSTPHKRDHVWEYDRIPFAAADDPVNEYRNNVQIADLNMLNAALAVIKWKKLCGFYVDLDSEHHSVYEIDGNFIHNEDTAHDGDTPDPHEAAAPDGLTAVEGTSVSTGNVAGEDGDETNRAAA
jgi:hypothetical protein